MSEKKTPKPRALSIQEQLFVSEYLRDYNATAAVVRAGYSPNGAEVTGSRLLTRPHVKAALAAKIRPRLTKNDITADRTLLELGRNAYLDPIEFFYQVGHPQAGEMRPIVELEEDVRRCLASYEVARANLDKTDGKRSVEFLHKFKFNDKLKALELLAKIHGMLKDVVEVQTDWEKLAARIASIRQEPPVDRSRFLGPPPKKATTKKGPDHS